MIKKEIWIAVSKQKFEEKLKDSGNVYSSMNMMIDPPRTFYWNEQYSGNKAFGEGSFGLIIHDYDPYTGLDKIPKFYLKGYEADQSGQ